MSENLKDTIIYSIILIILFNIGISYVNPEIGESIKFLQGVLGRIIASIVIFLIVLGEQSSGKNNRESLDDIIMTSQGTPVERAIYNQMKRNNKK